MLYEKPINISGEANKVVVQKSPGTTRQQQPNQLQQPPQQQQEIRLSQQSESVDLRQMFNIRNEETDVELMSPMAFAASDAAVVVPPHMFAAPLQVG